MQFSTYLNNGHYSTQSRLETFADSCNFLARHTLLFGRVSYKNKAFEFNKNEFLDVHEKMWKNAGGNFGVLPASIIIGAVHLAIIPFALIALCIGLPIKMKCVNSDPLSKTYHIALQRFNDLSSQKDHSGAQIVKKYADKALLDFHMNVQKKQIESTRTHLISFIAHAFDVIKENSKERNSLKRIIDNISSNNTMEELVHYKQEAITEISKMISASANQSDALLKLELQLQKESAA